jgi:hypothetical protein
MNSSLQKEVMTLLSMIEKPWRNKILTLVKKNNSNRSASLFGRRYFLIPVIVLCALYFMRSFVLYIDIINPVYMDECHTGAVAREILEHGFQFPLQQYTPEYYENSIIVESLLTVVSARLMGLSRLSLEIVPFLFSFATLLVFCSLLIRAGYKSGLWFFIISYFFISGMFVYITMDSVGNHIIGLFLGALILHQFYGGYVNRNPKHFYKMMFIIGLGLFVHVGSLLYALLCLLVYLLYKPATGTRPRLSSSMKIKGAMLLLLGACPFIIFLFKTKMMNVISLFTVASRRNIGVQDWAAYARKAGGQFLFQFDDRLWLLAFYSIMFLFVLSFWVKLRKQDVPAKMRLLVYIICFFTMPVFAAVSVISGGEFTTYHAYLMPLLFMAGSVVFSSLTDRYFSTTVSSAAAQVVLSMLILTMLMSNAYQKQFNLSPRHAIRELTSNKNLAFCYWRFGSSFNNYVSYDGDSAKYASEILSACGRFDSAEKRDECLWGWNIPVSQDGFTLDSQAVEVLGPTASGLIARTIGGWSSSINTCLKVDKAYVDDCILGSVERNAIKLDNIDSYWSMIKGLEKSNVRIPCLPKSPRFTGLIEEIRGRLREGTLDNGPQPCPNDLKIICIEADAYCAATEKRMDFCDSSYASPDDLNLCRFVFQQVRMAQEAKATRYIPRRTAPPHAHHRLHPSG